MVLAFGIESVVKFESSIDGIRKANMELGEEKSSGGFRSVKPAGEYSSSDANAPELDSDRSCKIISSVLWLS
jgi:hypothetical protein